MSSTNMYQRMILKILVFICLVYCCHTAEAPFRVKLNKLGQFIDQYGRVRMFHGFNSVQKSFPWYDHQINNVTRLKLYKEWGFNVVRLGTMWSGAQPTQNKFNQTYIDFMKKVVTNLNDYGIYSLLDMHQDVLSSNFGTYDGAPLWLINQFPKVSPEFKFPFPLKENKTYFWSDYYITYATVNGYQQLYTSDLGVKSWRNFWVKIATEFRSLKSVIGYELINEPWVGNFYEKPNLLLPGNAGKYNLMPAYDKLVDGIRKEDNETLVFYEPVTLGAYLPTTGEWGTGFDRVPGGPTEVSRSVLSYHYYCFFLTTGDPSRTFSESLRFICDNILASQLFNSTIDNVKKTGGGLFLTEFGGCEPDGNPRSVNTIECDTVLSLADSNYQSYTYWNSNFFTPDISGQVRPFVVSTFARAYPRAVQGNPIHYSFNRVTTRMTLTYSLDTNIKAPTEIFLPITVHYTAGFTNTTLTFPTNIQMNTTFNKDDFLFVLSPMRGQKIPSGTMVSVTIVTK